MWLSRTLRITCLVAMASLAAGCAFQPLYGERGGMNQTALAVSNVDVTLPDNRLGLLIRNELIFLMGTSDGGSLYELVVVPAASEVALFSNTVGEVTSYSYRLAATWTIQAKSTGEVLTSGRSQTAASYNRTDQPYANVRAQRDAEERAARLLAENISTRVAAYFATLQPTGVK